MILVITSKSDAHVDPVATHLDALNHPWVRINTEDLATNFELEVDPTLGTGSIRIRDSGRQFRIEDVSAVWYRKPDPIAISHFAVDAAGLEYIEAEFQEILQGLYGLLDHATWINNPFTCRRAHRKLVQLKAAHRVGLNTPRSIVSNNASAVLAFAATVKWDLAIKSLGSISVSSQVNDQVRQYGVFTRRIDKQELLGQRAKISHMPTIFQEYVHKAYELRVTVVGAKAFFCKIHSQASEDSAEDVRFNIRSLPHEIVDMPELQSKLLAYMQSFQLNFACFDLAVTPSGEPVFFECNPNGQWLWIEQLTGAAIAKSIADLLVGVSAASEA